MRKITTHQKARFALVTVALLLGAAVHSSLAQGGGPNLIQTAEYDIGLDCPVTAALDPAGTTLWVLMDNCFQGRYALHAYSVADGTRLPADDYASALTVLRGVYVDLFITPMGFTPAGDLSIRYNDPDTYESVSLLIPLAGGGEATLRRSDSYNALLASTALYPEFSVYSPDHTRVVTFGPDSLHVLDVQAETEVIEIPVEGGTDYVQASFSADGQRLHVITLNAPQDLNDFSSTLLVFNLPDGALLRRYVLPSSAVWVSPDEAYAAVQLFSNDVTERSELMVIDLESGLASSPSNLLQAPAPVITCLNTGHNVSDLGYMTRGYMTLANLQWLPDSSGLLVSLSYDGDGAEGGSGSACIFNYSRLRTYRVAG
jgi:hypothetical protein